MRHIGWDGKADPHRAARAREDRGIDADEVALQIDQRPAGISRIDGGVGLNEIVEITGLDASPCQGRDNPAGHRLADAEWVADGQHQIADLDAVRIGELQCRENLAVGFVDLQHREVRFRIVEQQFDRVFPPAIERDVDFVGAIDHVRIGDDHPLGVDDHARSERLAGLRPALEHVAAEKARKERVVGERRLKSLLGLGGVDVHHRRRHLFHQRRKTQLDIGLRFGQFPARRTVRRDRRLGDLDVRNAGAAFGHLQVERQAHRNGRRRQRLRVRRLVLQQQPAADRRRDHDPRKSPHHMPVRHALLHYSPSWRERKAQIPAALW